MQWKRRYRLIIAIACVVIILLGGLILDGYYEGRQIVLHDYDIALRFPAMMAIHTKQNHLHGVLSAVRTAGIDAVEVGIYHIKGNRIVDRYTLPSTPFSQVRDRMIRPILRSGRSAEAYGVPSVYVTTFPIVSSGTVTGSVFFVVPSKVMDGQLNTMVMHQLLISFFIVLFSIIVTFAFNRLLTYLNKEPTQIANWVHALVVDPFATPPDSLELLDPLTQVILDMRSRVYMQDALVKAVMTSAPIAIIHLSLDFTIQMINDAMSALTGLDSSQILNLPILRLKKILLVDYKDMSILIHRLYKGEPVRNLEIILIHHISKEIKHALVSIIPNTMSTGDLIGYTIFAEDITMKKQWEQYTEKTDRLNLIAELAASTAHEIRNPLTTVRGFLQLQKKRTPPETGKDHFQIMIDEIDRVDSLITEYLTLARDTVATAFETTAIDTIVWDLFPLVSAEANMKGVVISVLDLPQAHCCGSRQELKQVFLNLIKNALDAMSNGGVLTVYGTRTSSTYTVAIADTGSGIDTDHIDHIFEPFYTTKPTGSGLGLAVSKKIIDSHQGEIQVDSTLDEGTTFFITLPLLSE